MEKTQFETPSIEMVANTVLAGTTELCSTYRVDLKDVLMHILRSGLGSVAETEKAVN